jgi:hypothetical protein
MSTNSVERISAFTQSNKKYPFLKSLHIDRTLNEGGCSEYHLTIALCNFPFYEGDPQFVLTFSEAKDIKIGSLQGMLRLMIEITDISKDQLEGMNYKLHEEEYDLLSFCCEDFDFQVIDS